MKSAYKNKSSLEKNESQDEIPRIIWYKKVTAAPSSNIRFAHLKIIYKIKMGFDNFKDF